MHTSFTEYIRTGQETSKHGPILLIFLLQLKITMEIIFCCNSTSDHPIATKFVHVWAAVLSWHVQKFVAITVLLFKQELKYFFVACEKFWVRWCPDSSDQYQQKHGSRTDPPPREVCCRDCVWSCAFYWCCVDPPVDQGTHCGVSKPQASRGPMGFVSSILNDVQSRAGPETTLLAANYRKI